MSITASTLLNKMTDENELHIQVFVYTPSEWICYLLQSEDGYKTYVGITRESTKDRRVRQHNGEIVGGAKATKDNRWFRRAYVRHFPDKRSVLQFEWAWKWWTKKTKGCTGLSRRIKAVQSLLQSERSTKQAVPFRLFGLPLEIVWESQQH